MKAVTSAFVFYCVSFVMGIITFISGEFHVAYAGASTGMHIRIAGALMVIWACWGLWSEWKKRKGSNP